MKQFLKKHIGLVVLLVMILSFPASLSTQARLNMRVMITGLALDKSDDGYELTAQIVKTTPDSESGGSGATINFVSEKASDVLSLISKISYKTGKIAGFSHINFIVIGNDLLSEDLSQTLDYFVRDKIIKDSILILYSKGKAKDEIKKTKEMELSVGLGLQKVFLYKEKESDGKMTTLLSFMKNSKNISKTSVVSCLSLKNASTDQSESQGAGEQLGGSDEQSGDSGEQSDESGKQSSSTQASSEEKYQYFESFAPMACFVSGRYVGSLENEDEIVGFMMTQNQAITDEIVIDNVNFGSLNNARIGVKIKHKSSKIKIRYEENLPVVDIFININNSEIRDVKNDAIIGILSQEEHDYIKRETEKAISEKIAKVFEKSKEIKADIFGAYDLATKFHYKKTKANFDSMEEFLQQVKLNANVKILSLEY